jgi:hypothetical protein
VSAYRVNFDDNQGFSDVSNWPLTFAFGLKDKAEIFGAWTNLVSRVDRDTRPLFVAAIPQAGGTVPTNPLMTDAWSGNQLGDFWLGAKWNLMSQWQQKAVRVRAAADDQAAHGQHGGRRGTGKLDVAFDAVLSKEVNQRLEWSGYGGVIFRGSPDEVETTNGFRWGVGVGVRHASRCGSPRMVARAYFDSCARREVADPRGRRLVRERGLVST